MSVVPVSLGHHYAVSAGHELAALAAFEVLDGGGNAVDAGVAAILTLGVVYSDHVSIAGVAPMMIYLAERDDHQFEMEVALKLLPLGLVSEEAQRRFLGERQILAKLTHPGILAVVA